MNYNNISNSVNDVQTIQSDDRSAIGQIKTYPNPTRDLVMVEFKQAGVSAIEIYDLSGRKIWTQQENILATQFLLNLKDYSASVYEVRLVNKQGQFLASTAIVKQ